MRIVQQLILYYLIYLALPATAAQINNPAVLPEHEPTILTVAVEHAGYFPFNFIDNNRRTGFSVDVLNYFQRHSNFKFEFIVVPWPRALFLLEKGKVDLVLTLFKTPEREKIYHFIEPAYASESSQLFTLKDRNIDFNGQLEQLTPYTVGTVREYSYGYAFDNAKFINKPQALTEDNLVKLLLGNRVDMIIGNPLIINNVIRKRQATGKIKALDPAVETTPVHMALTKARPDAEQLRQRLDELTSQLKSSPFYQQLLNKYQLGEN